EEQIGDFVGLPARLVLELLLPRCLVVRQAEIDRDTWSYSGRDAGFEAEGHVRRMPPPTRCGDSPSAALAASITASPSVGCGWTVSARSGKKEPISSASAASEIRSDASGPTMPTPSTSSVCASAITFTKPSVSAMASARPRAANGYFPIFTLRP